jgi:hypothetical protein
METLRPACEKCEKKNPLQTDPQGSLLSSSGPAENLRPANKHRTPFEVKWMADTFEDIS